MRFTNINFSKNVLLFVFGFVCCLLFFGGNNLPVQAQEWSADYANPKALGGEYKFPDNFCLTDESRAEIHAQIRESVENLRAEGKLSAISPLFVPPSFIFPVRGNGTALNDFGVHGISNFVDQNPAFPNQILDYNCGMRTYDQSSGYNHKGVDIFTFPFGFNKMDADEVAIVAAADGTIIYKSNGNFDRSCSFNNNNWNAVYLQHADGTVSWYGHMKNNSQTTKPVGATVTQGEFLGIVGSSGNSTGPHLHFELYNPSNQLQDPYQGTCNTLNTNSYWQNQLPYRDSKINKLMTHSAPPSFSTCPNPDVKNEKTVFQPGEQLIVAGYYHDQVAGQVTQYSLLQPDGVAVSNWTQTSPNTYNASYWYWTFTIPQGVPGGTWKIRAVYQNQTYEQIFSILSPNKTRFDLDGDNKTDVSIFRPSVGQWWYLRSSDGSNRAFSFGSSTDKIVPADFTGDRKTDIAFWRESSGEWFILRSEDFSFYSFPFGTSGDKPVAADFDSDGKADPAIFRSSNATWYILNSSGGTRIQQFGTTEDLPVANDYDGDGKADLAIFRPSNGQWWINRSASQTTNIYNFGTSTDKLVPADYTGDGKTDVAFFRPSSGEWFILRSENASFYSFPFGQTGDIPAPGDYDGDGKADAAIFRDSNTTWYLQRSTSGFAAVGFGLSGDRPVPSAFVP
jgi:murein DD-endopeptidase MepM/ murein hydrolase activator NlpD